MILEQIYSFLQMHPLLIITCGWIFAAIVTTMPPPLPTERWYGWLYNAFQAIAANLDKVGNKTTAAARKIDNAQ